MHLRRKTGKADKSSGLVRGGEIIQVICLRGTKMPRGAASRATEMKVGESVERRGAARFLGRRRESGKNPAGCQASQVAKRRRAKRKKQEVLKGNCLGALAQNAEKVLIRHQKAAGAELDSRPLIKNQ